jgi:hypothetical protein
MEPDQPYSYDAFVSYSHEADGDFASKLVSAIRAGRYAQAGLHVASTRRYVR